MENGGSKTYQDSTAIIGYLYLPVHGASKFSEQAYFYAARKQAGGLYQVPSQKTRTSLVRS